MQNRTGICIQVAVRNKSHDAVFLEQGDVIGIFISFPPKTPALHSVRFFLFLESFYSAIKRAVALIFSCFLRKSCYAAGYFPSMGLLLKFMLLDFCLLKLFEQIFPQ